MAASYQLNVDQGAQLQRRIIYKQPSKKFTADLSNVLTSYGHEFVNTDKVYVSSVLGKQLGELPGPLKAGRVYFVISATQDTFKLATTSGGSEIDLTTVGKGTHYIAKPVDLTGYTAVWYILPSGQAVFVTDGTKCFIESPGSNGVIILDVPDEDTVLFTSDGQHYLELLPPSGKKVRLFDGKMKLDKKPI